MFALFVLSIGIIVLLYILDVIETRKVKTLSTDVDISRIQPGDLIKLSANGSIVVKSVIGRSVTFETPLPGTDISVHVYEVDGIFSYSYPTSGHDIVEVIRDGNLIMYQPSKYFSPKGPLV